MKKIIRAIHIKNVVLNNGTGYIVKTCMFRDMHTDKVLGLEESFIMNFNRNIEGEIIIPSPFNNDVSLLLVKDDGLKLF